jgi:hypothetical protein
MALPKIKTPTFTAEIPSTNKKIKLRPFLVKEEKMLLIAAKTNSTEIIVENLNNVLKNCILSDDVDVEKLTSYDAQWLFLKLREVSMGSMIDAKVKCPVTNKFFDTQISVSNAKIIKEKRENKIVLDDKLKIGVVLRDLSLAEIYSQVELAKTDEYSAMMNLLCLCIVEVFDKDSVYPAKDSTQEELIDFLESLQKEQFDKINQFFEKTPKIKLEEEVFSMYANQNVKLVLENFMDFFA